MRFVEPATDSGAIYVNPQTVAYVKPNETTNCTILVQGQLRAVAERASHVVLKLDRAMQL